MRRLKSPCRRFIYFIPRQHHLMASLPLLITIEIYIFCLGPSFFTRCSGKLFTYLHLSYENLLLRAARKTSNLSFWRTYFPRWPARVQKAPVVCNRIPPPPNKVVHFSRCTHHRRNLTLAPRRQILTQSRRALLTRKKIRAW